MKTPEEIKKALECCAADELCEECPYHPEVNSCIGMIARDALSYIRQLENQVADLGKKVSKWIDVDERLPNLNDEVLIAVDGYVYGAQYWKYSNGMAFGTETADDIFSAGHEKDHVSHWMYMPEPPKEEQHD